MKIPTDHTYATIQDEISHVAVNATYNLTLSQTFRSHTYISHVPIIKILQQALRGYIFYLFVNFFCLWWFATLHVYTRTTHSRLQELNQLTI